MLTLLFDGVAYGMLLFVLAIGLSITLGLMNFINLAHGAFAMAGGYTLVLLMQKAGWPFLPSVLMAFAVSALLGLLLEVTLYRRMYQKPHLDQVLFSIGLTFMAVAAVDYFVGSTQQLVQLPEFLKGRTELWDGALGMGHYRLAIIAVCAVLALVLQLLLVRTRFGAQLRAAVDNQRVAAGLGIDVNMVFLLTFAVGSGLAGLGGALGAEVLGLDPIFPLKFMIYFLIVVNFQSWRDPLVIISALPAALAGIVWMLFTTRTTLSVPALTGAIMCMGVATANSVLVITFARERLAESGQAITAALDAGFVRFRPVLMTALAMVIGMLPMALGLGEGGEQNAPLGRAVIGGLIFATIATLIFVPVVFALAHEKDHLNLGKQHV